LAICTAIFSASEGVGRPKLIYPRRGFSLRNLLQNRLGLDAAAQVLPALPALFSLRTPLYLMQ